jgi:lipopolysaccharide export LptBFGC system permease protein LptF
MSLCFFYVVALSGARSGLDRGHLPIELGLWWIHGLFIVITFLVFQMDHFGAFMTAVIDRFRPVAKA